MAKIFKTASIRIPSPGGVPDTFTEDEMELMVTNYWGNIDNERTFPIAIWKLERLLDASTTDEVALRITDIKNPNKVDGRWLVFDGNFEDALADPNQPNLLLCTTRKLLHRRNCSEYEFFSNPAGYEVHRN